MRIRAIGVALLAWLAVLPIVAQAAQDSAEGVASLAAGRLAARELAIHDALRQLSIRRGGGLVGASLGAESGVAESALLGAPSSALPFRVVSERETDGLLYVTVSQSDVEPVAIRAEPEAHGQQCAGGALPPGRFLKRRALTTFFAIRHPQQATGLGEVSHWLPAELARRLSEQGSVSAADGGRYTLFADGRQGEPLAGRDAARGFGQREGVQFVVAGELVDSAVTREAPRLSLFGQPNTSVGAVRYIGPLAGFLGAAIEVAPVRRRFAMDVWLYDALTGALLFSQRFEGEAEGDVAPASARWLPPYQFAGSAYGRMVSGLLDQATQQLAVNIACLPFSTRVARVDGGKVYLEAGAVDGLAVGDRLLVYQQRPAEEIRTAAGHGLGVPEVLLGDLALVQVQPRMAIGIMNGGRPPLVGDLVRFPFRGS